MKLIIRLTVAALLVAVTSLFFFGKNGFSKPGTNKINGVNFVAPPRPIDSAAMRPIKSVNANWVAIVPYAFSNPTQPFVNFDYPHQWWGEKKEGAAQTVVFAKKLNLNVMLKPHVWVRGHGWPGDYQLSNEKDWTAWESDYEHYITEYAKLADSLHVEMLCIATEYRKAVVQRPEFWDQLIPKLRKVYGGKLTYAANWDNYHNVQFWDKLDFIGVDAYFPISTKKTPNPNDLINNWEGEKQKLKALSKKLKKPIIFTEYGYQSIDYSTDGHWKYDKDTLAVNMASQANAYEALYRSFWNEDWFEGGFLWKWHANDANAGGAYCKRFTPQNKPASKVIRQYYGKK